MNEVGAMLGSVMLRTGARAGAVERGRLVVGHRYVLDRRDEQQHREGRPGPGRREITTISERSAFDCHGTAPRRAAR